MIIYMEDTVRLLTDEKRKELIEAGVVKKMLAEKEENDVVYLKIEDEQE